MANLLLKRIKDWIPSISSFRTGDVIPVDGPSGTAKMSKDDLLKETAQNALAGNVAPAFDPTKPNDAGGYAYYKNDVVAYNGATYKFKVNHSSGAWNASHVDRYDIDNKLKIFIVTDNPEYLYAITDNDDMFLFGVKKDGSVEWAVGVPNEIKKALIGKVDKVSGKSLVDSTHADALLSGNNPEYIKFLVDAEDKLIGAVKNDGSQIFFTPLELKGGVKWTPDNISELAIALKENGFTSGQGDWSDSKSLSISTPDCAIVNFTNIQSMPETKTTDAHGIMEFWDGRGNYFKKNVVMNAQGQSSLVYPKKNISIDICNDEWEGDDTFKLTIGDWVTQDSYHIKAYYTDFFRCVGGAGFDIFRSIIKTRGVTKDAPWKKALIPSNTTTEGDGTGYGVTNKLNLRMNTGATCYPQGFPCIVFLNGEFYGVFSWQLKKHRDNYAMKKSTVTNIHLDGRIDVNTFFGGSITWSQIEVRNPKDLIDIDGNKYDGDDPKELIDSSAPAYDPTNSKHVLTNTVKGYITSFASVMSSIASARETYGSNSEEVKELIEASFDVENLVDYVLFSDIVNNYDGFAKNWQWVTYDGVKWYVCPYDLDGILGNYFEGDRILPPIQSHLGAYNNKIPTYYVTHRTDYTAMLEQRYSDLRKSGIITAEKLVDSVSSWMGKVGFANYEKEFAKWPGSPGDSQNVIDSDRWELVLDGEGQPVMAEDSNYDPATTYNVDDTCSYGVSAFMGYYTFKAIVQTTGNAPITSFGYRDSLWRLESWISKQVENCDFLYNFNNQ